MQRTITITNNAASALAQHRTVTLVLDHASLVSSRRSRADGYDIQVSKNGVVRPHHARFLNTSATEILFSLEDAISASGSDTYTLHIGVIDDDRDRYPVPMRTKSQWDIEQQTPAFRTVRRNQPFAYYDGFVDTFDGSELRTREDFTSGIPDALLYDPTTVGLWTQTVGGVVSAPSGSGNLSLFWRNFNHATVTRIRCTMAMFPGFTLAGAGAICNGGAAGLSGYTGGVGTDTLNGFTAVFSAGVPGSSAASLLGQNVAGLPINAGVSYDGSDVGGECAGVELTKITSGFHTARTLAGIWTATTGASGGPAFSEAWAEVWDGVDDSDITVSVASLEPELPCPAAPGLKKTNVRVPAGASSQETAVVLVEALSHQTTPTFELSWPVMTRDDWWELRALWFAQRGGAGTFTWTPPQGGTAEQYRFVPASLQLAKATFNAPSATVQIERVVQ